jgi:hypothetical protein
VQVREWKATLECGEEECAQSERRRFVKWERTAAAADPMDLGVDANLIRLLLTWQTTALDKLVVPIGHVS